MFKKLRAFTMAEAILVMTILGIIATIMISTLKPAEYKEKSMQIMAKKVLSEIDVATTQILMNNTADGTFDMVYFPGTSNIISIDDGTATVKSGADALGDLYKGYLTALRKEPESGVGQNSFLLKDGAMISIVFIAIPRESNRTNTIFPGETELTNSVGGYGEIVFDINDNEPPNVWGKDKFKIPIYKYGIRYAD